MREWRFKGVVEGLHGGELAVKADLVSVGLMWSYQTVFAHKGVLPFSLGKTQALGAVFLLRMRQSVRSSMTLLGRAAARVLPSVFGISILPIKDTSHDWFLLRQWRVSWVGGWTRDRLSFLVMLVHVIELSPK